MRRARRGAAAAIALSLSLGCGSEVSETARMEPMGPAATENETSVEKFVDVPNVASLRFEPDAPLAGRSAVVHVEMAEDASDLELDYVWTVGGRAAKSAHGRVDLSEAMPGSRLQVTVTPRIGETAGHPVSRAVRLRSPAPRVVGVSFSPPNGYVSGTRIEARPMVEDGDPHDTAYHYQWLVNGQRESAYESHFDTSALRRGDTVQVEVKARSAGETSEPFLSETLELANTAPQLAARPLSWNEDGSLDAQLEAPDPDGDTPVTFALLKGPAGLTISANGRMAWPSERVLPGSHPVEVEVSDSLGAKRTSRFALQVGSPAAPAD